MERVLLELRLARGCPAGARRHRRAAIDDLVRRGLLERAGERPVLTVQGRLLADAVVRDLLP